MAFNKASEEKIRTDFITIGETNWIHFITIVHSYYNNGYSSKMLFSEEKQKDVPERAIYNIYSLRSEIYQVLLDFFHFYPSFYSFISLSLSIYFIIYEG